MDDNLLPTEAPLNQLDQTESGWMLADGAEIDHFRITRPLGRGGMAEVYLAQDRKLNRRVALKVYRPDDRSSERQLIEEARATAKFNHPQIVTVYAVGHSGRSAYMALEYVEGRNFRDHLSQSHVTPQEAVGFGLQLAEALKAAHAHGIVHRDLKPENVMLTGDGRLRVLDFGLARTSATCELSQKQGEESSPAARFTGVKGTPPYMAPEQWQAKETIGATDVWALGVMLHEMVFGRRPLADCAWHRLAARVCSAAPMPVADDPNVSKALKGLISDCLEKDPERRPSMAEVCRRLGWLKKAPVARIGVERLDGRSTGCLDFRAAKVGGCVSSQKVSWSFTGSPACARALAGPAYLSSTALAGVRAA